MELSQSEPRKPASSLLQHAPLLLRLVFSSTGIRIALCLFDTATDLYAAYRYYIMESQWRNVAFYGLLTSLVFHNLVSTVYGVRHLFRAHRAKPLPMLDRTWWQVLIVVAHLMGLGNVMIPLSLVFSAKDWSPLQLKER